MAKLITFTCDECGALKQPSNGWWIAVAGDTVASQRDGELTLMPMPNDADLNEHARTLCGRACVQKVVELHMQAVGVEHAEKAGEAA